MTPLAVCIFFVLSVIPTAIGIKCFECRSDFDPNCADPFDNTTILITDCSYRKDIFDKVGVCRKMKQKVNGTWVYTRDCAAKDDIIHQGGKQTCYTRTGNDSHPVEFCTCDNKDACNSAYLFTSKPTVLVTLVIMPWFMLKLVM